MADQGGIATQSAPKPPGKTTESAPEPPGSESGTRTPEGTTAGDKTDHPASSSDKKSPDSSSTSAKADKAPPTADKAPPAAGKAPPAADKMPPAADKVPPAADKAPPAADKAPPAADKAPPGADKATPGADKAPPGADKATPAADKATPGADKATPAADKAPPAADKAPPAADKAPPATDKAPPATDKAPPATDKAAPAADKASTDGDKPPADKPPTDGDHAAPSADHPSPAADQPPPAGDRKASAESLLSGTQTPTMDSMQALSKIRELDGIQYSVPVTPDHFLIPGGMVAGSEVYIFGLLSPQCSSVDVKFREGRTLEQVSMNVHVVTEATPYVALQTHLDNKTNDVVKEDFEGITPGGPLCIRVKTYPDESAKVTLNGHTLNFPPSDTFKVEKVLYFSIFGDFFTGSVSIFKKEWPDHMHVTIGHHISAGYHFTIQGAVTPDADKLMMNILRCSEVHDDELLGVVAQFTDPKQLVRRTKQEGVWLEDQVDQDDPFEQGKPFTVEIAVCEQDFHMTVNGKLLPPYKHKVFYGTGHNLCLEKNIKFKSLNVCSISHPKHWEHKLPNILKASILLFDAKSPASTPIQMAAGNSFLLQGTPPPPCNEFKLILSKGMDETSEALLVIHALLGKGLVYVYDGTDANKGDGQKLRVRANRLFSCRVDALADSFKVYVNTLSEVGNTGPFEVKQRFPLTDAIFLNTYGELNNVTALKATEDILA